MSSDWVGHRYGRRQKMTGSVPSLRFYPHSSGGITIGSTRDHEFDGSSAVSSLTRVLFGLLKRNGNSGMWK